MGDIEMDNNFGNDQQARFDPMTGQPLYPNSGSGYNGTSYSSGSAYQGGNAYSAGGAYQGGSAYPGGNTYQGGSAYSAGNAYQGGSAYPGGNAYQGGSAYPGSAYPGAGGYQQGYGAGGFDGGYGMPPKKKGSLPTGAIIGIAAGGAAVLAAILAVIFVLIPSGAFLSKQNKVAMAAYQTFNKSTLGGVVVDAGKVVSSDELTAEIEASAGFMGYGGSVAGAVSSDANAGKASIDAEIEVSGVIKQSVVGYMDDSTVQLALPDLMDEVVVYDYTREGGCMDEILQKISSGSSYDLNMVLSAANGLMMDSAKNSKKTMKAVKKAYSKLDTEKLDKQEFEIDGKDRKCEGYRITVTEDDVNDLLKEISEISGDTYHDNLVDLAAGISNLTGSYFAPESLSQEVPSVNMADIVIDAYLYKGQLAAIQSEGMSVEFRGGDTRCSNVVINNQGYEVMRLESSIKKGVEKGTISSQGMTIADYSYDRDNGKFSINAVDAGSYSGKFLVKGGSIELNMGITGIADVSAKIKDKANIKKPKGDEVVINDYSLMELASLFIGPLQTLVGPLMNGLGSFF